MSTPPVPTLGGCHQMITDAFETPLGDKRSYRLIVLSNRLEVLLVHDPKTDKASAAMDVNAGSFCDPEGFLGVAHSIEHLLFLGTKKYPDENGFDSFLSKHSGALDAWTPTTSTYFGFEITAGVAKDTPNSDKPFYVALDRFAQFFIAPLFLSSTVDRELRAVDSEHKSYLQNDQYRLCQLFRSLSNPNHPFHKYNVGNLNTLKTSPEAEGRNVRAEIIEHWNQYYSANGMKLVIMGQESLETLENWATYLFGIIKNKNLPPNRWGNEVPLRKEELLTQCFAKPIENEREITLYFPFLDEEFLFESQPSRYISYLINHEGQGSILGYLRSKGWANYLFAGPMVICPGTPNLFYISILGLTESGVTNYHKIVKVIFQYLFFLNETEPQEWIFDELKDIAERDFKFQQKEQAIQFTKRISAAMQEKLPRDYLLSGHLRLRKFDSDDIKSGLRLLNPHNFNMTIISQIGDWDKKEKWFGTDYKYERIPVWFLKELQSITHIDHLPELHLPAKNLFIPTRFEVEKRTVIEPALTPQLIRHDKIVRGWFKKDDTFWVPQANFVIKCHSPFLGVTAENALKARIYISMVLDTLSESLYSAEVAGLDCSVTISSGDLFIKLTGYNDKLAVLLNEVLSTMRDLIIKPDRFEVKKEELLRHIQNSGYDKPYKQVEKYYKLLIGGEEFTDEQLHSEFPSLTPESIQSYFPCLLQEIHIEMLVHGNVFKEDALKLMHTVDSILKPRGFPQTEWPAPRILVFPPGSNFIFENTLRDPENVNHCIEYVLYIGERGDRILQSKGLLLSQMMTEPAFHELRTKEQLGYIVLSGLKLTATTIGYYFIVQSERKPQHLETKIETFLTEYLTKMQKMSEEDFEVHKKSSIEKCLKKPMNLNEESSRLWQHIISEYFDFEFSNHHVQNITRLSKKDMIGFFEHFVSPDSPHRAKLSIHLLAQGTSSTTAVVDSIAEARKEAMISPTTKILTNETDNFTPHDMASNLYIIENEQALRSLLSTSTRSQPVTNLSNFEDLVL